MKYSFLAFFLFIFMGVFAQDWKTNFEESQQKAMAENKNIILVFSGSDWCAPCMKLE